jgi:hypothetical protein
MLYASLSVRGEAQAYHHPFEGTWKYLNLSVEKNVATIEDHQWMPEGFLST